MPHKYTGLTMTARVGVESTVLSNYPTGSGAVVKKKVCWKRDKM
jgi:hypothetical protein